MTTHSPTPWNLAENPSQLSGHIWRRVRDANGKELLLHNGDGWLSVADLEHIVRCVNLHDELVACVDHARDLLCGLIPSNAVVIARIDAVLAKAKSQP